MRAISVLMAYITGMAFVGGAACAWRYWHVDSLLCSVFAIIGVAFIGSALPEKGSVK